ncbi:MFS transporter [Pantoea sp. JZ29]|nr:MFS transporter [Pantoea sp. JZ29]
MKLFFSERRSKLHEGMTAMAFFCGSTWRLFLINITVAVSYTFILPVMSIFLINGLHASPVFLTFYSLGTSLSGLFFCQLMGSLSDKGYPDKRLFILSVLALSLTGIAFAYCRYPVQALLIGIFLLGPGNACVTLFLSIIRKHSLEAGINPTRLNTQMRTCVSVVWIAGPTLAFIFADRFGFAFDFLISALLSGMTILLCHLMLPVGEKTSGPGIAKSDEVRKPRISSDIWALGAVIILANLSNKIYMTVMPLYLVKDLNLPVSFPGFLLGSAAIIEIPVMLAASRLADKTGKELLFMAGFLFASAYYCLLLLASNRAELIALQILNAVSFGIFTALGISVIQDALPERSGFASAFYFNAMRTGMIAGNGITGLMAQLTGFRMTLIIPFLSVSCAALIMLCINNSRFMKKRQ